MHKIWHCGFWPDEHYQPSLNEEPKKASRPLGQRQRWICFLSERIWNLSAFEEARNMQLKDPQKFMLKLLDMVSPVM